MQVVQTADVPPNHGRIILAMTGWTSKSRKAESEMVRAYRSMDLRRTIYAIPIAGAGGGGASQELMSIGECYVAE